ncbi:hypothetical protein BDW74DRAFT_172330 [Aspergillus multicolor]|uniref:uncharacterized protein n=1 Tax=Aspergillus multicolor TaxID=41759 RepID=UPI003CCD3868
MEPLSALSIATAVIQIVEFATKLVSKSKELYTSESGVLADHAEKAAISSRLNSLSKGLLLSVNGIPTSQKLSPAQEGLRQVAEETQVLAEDFLATLDRLKVDPTKRKWTSFRQALKSVWTKEQLEGRMVILDRLGRVVVIHLLIILNEGQVKAVATTDDALRSMEDRVQNTLLQHKGRIEEILNLLQHDLGTTATRASDTAQERDQEEERRTKLLNEWAKDHRDILSQILQTIQQSQLDQHQKSFKQVFIKSLSLPRMYDRQSLILENYDATLGWVFQASTERPQTWSDLSKWLREPGGLYWVSGKAGSGKSTFMKWLLHEQRTEEALRAWAGDKQLLVASHFFWSSGTEDQKSISGFLRSLLHELLIQSADEIWELSPSRWRAWDLELGYFPAWSDDELLSTLQNLLVRYRHDYRICLFIDGLDELAGDDDQREKVFHFLHASSQEMYIKLCVSSRPWELFKDNFSSYPHLRLEELTSLDIKRYIDEKLEANERFLVLRQQNTSLCIQLVREIIERAKGVWLWVVLVTRSLLRGLRNHDTVADLLDRLRAVPEELEEYFLQMFSNIEPFYRPKSLKLLKMALNFPGTTSLMTYSFLDETDLASPTTGTGKWTDDALDQRLQRAESRVNIFCLDLLQASCWGRERHILCRHSVDFLHRTARDFLLESRTQDFLQMQSVAEFNVGLFICRALVTQMEMVTQPPRRLIFEFMRHAEELEPQFSQELLPLLDRLAQVLDGPREPAVYIDDIPPGRVLGWSCRTQGLLPLAIQYGLNRYAKVCLASDPSLVIRQRDRPLLDCALRRRIYSPLTAQAEQIDYLVGGLCDQPDPELVSLILQHGGNPNETYGDSTIWKLFLNFLSSFARDLRKLDANDRQVWVRTTELLIRNGAARVLERYTVIPEQPSSRIRVRLSYGEVIARETLAAAFGEDEADRLDSLAWRLNASGQTLFVNSVRTVRNLLRWAM